MRSVNGLRFWLILSLVVAGADVVAQDTRRRSLGAADSHPMRVAGGSELKTVTLGELEARQLVLYVFDGRCSDCRQQLVYLQRLQQSFFKGRGIQVVAIEVLIGKDVDAEPAPETAGLLALADVEGKVWSALLAMQATDSPPGAKEKADRVLPLTVFVGSWVLRHRGSERMPIDKYVRRRSLLLQQLMTGKPPPLAELDIENEDALRFGFQSSSPPDEPRVSPAR